MTDPCLFRLRCTFVKQGRLVLLSHLELIRAIERTIRRAGLPYAITQGFSPHMKIAFGSALPVGVGSTCELFDVMLTRYVPCDEALLLLQAASVPDLMIQKCAYVEPSAPAASIAFPYCTYQAEFDQEIDRIVVPDRISVVRKKKEKVLNVGDYLVGPFELEGCRALFTLEAKENGSLRPDLLLSECQFDAHLNALTRISQQAEYDA